MVFRTAPEKAREKILAFGGSGVGKSWSIPSLAQFVLAMNPKSRVYVLDSDDGIEKIWHDHFKSLKNTNFFFSPVTSWPQVMESMDELRQANLTSDDWVCIDMLGKFWEMAQSYEVNEVFGKKASEFLLVARAEAVSAAKLNKPVTLPGVDWTVVKKLHNGDFLDELATDFKCNVFATAAADPIIADFDDAKIVSMFQQVGAKPDGEKRNAHRFDTVMYLRMTRSGDRIFNTVKDRSRPLMEEVPFENLIVDYHESLQKNGMEGIFSDE